MPRPRWRSRLSDLLRAVAERLDPEPPAAAAPNSDAPDFWLERARGGNPMGTGAASAPPSSRARIRRGQGRSDSDRAVRSPAAGAGPSLGDPGVHRDDSGARSGPKAPTAAHSVHLGEQSRRRGAEAGDQPSLRRGGEERADSSGGRTEERTWSRDIPGSAQVRNDPGRVKGAATPIHNTRQSPATTTSHPQSGPSAPWSVLSAHFDDGLSRGDSPDSRPRARPLRDAPGSVPHPGAPQDAFVTARSQAQEPPQGLSGASGSLHGRRGLGAADPAGTAEPRTPGLGRSRPPARPAPTTPAGGNRLLLRPWATDPRPAHLAAREPGPAGSEPAPTAELWPDLPARPPALPEPPPVAAEFARWQRLTTEQAAT